MKKSILISSLFVLLTLAGLRAQEVAFLEHSTAGGYYNSLVQVDADTYVLAYQGSGQDGFISTFTVSADGTSIIEVDQLEHDEVDGKRFSVVHVYADTYVLAYTGNSGDGFISTFTIDGDGDITAVKTQSEGNNLEHDTNTGNASSIVQVDDDTYVLAYTGQKGGVGEVGMISTFTISADGTSITEVASLEHDGSGNQGTSNSLVQVDSDTYALAYTGGGQGGFISTFTIDGDGNITAVKTESEGNNLEHDTGRGAFNSLIQVDSDTYVLAYQGDDFDGWISTFTISSDGATITEVATLEFYEADSDDNGQNDMVEGNSLVQVDSDTYALTYGVQVGLYEHYGYITIFTIPTDGSSITQVASLKHSLSNGEWNSIVKVDADTYVNAYLGPGADGFIKTFTIASDGSLPVELTSFHVLSTRNDAVTLQWVTESEINNLGFILDRRVPGTEWTEIATYITHPELQGQGSVTHQTIYSYTDNTVLSAETYDYRLADVDYDGNKVYHSMTVMGVSPNDVVPETFTLYPAYPNPFNPTTNIRYDLPEDALVSITIYDIMGRSIRSLVNSKQTAGYRSIQWNATNDAGSPVSAGIYLYMIQAGEFRQAKKMVLLK
jgi:hypothetical protein